MKTVIIVRDRASLSDPVARALERCFKQRGWSAQSANGRVKKEPDLVAGWGFQDVMHDAWDRWPSRILHFDAGFWTRQSYIKIELGGRWLPVETAAYDGSRLACHGVRIHAGRPPGTKVLVCGMSAKAALSAGLQPSEWEKAAINRLRSAGATVIYRPKPTWRDAPPIQGAAFDRSSSIEQILREVHGVVSHHSNAAIDALAAGLPIYVHTGIAKSLSVSSLEDVVRAEAPDLETRKRFLQQVAWHQWTLDEIENGDWLKPPAPLSDHPIFAGECN